MYPHKCILRSMILWIFDIIQTKIINTSDRSTSLIVDGLGVYVKPTTQSTNSANGSLIVSGGAGISGNINVGGNLKVNLTATSTTTSTGVLVVSGGAGISGNIYVGEI